MEFLGRFQPYVKRYFQRHQWNTFFFRAQITQILLFLRILLLERSKVTAWERHLFKKIFFAMEVLSICLPYAKRYFQWHQWNNFSFRAQITQVLMFSGMPLLERSNFTVWERHLFKKFFCDVGFRYVSILRKKVFSAAPIKHFLL